MRISKVYTRKGDTGKTRLAGGQDVWKDSLRVEAYGTVDELNAIMGIVRAFYQDCPVPAQASLNVEAVFQWIQNKLFDLGAILATAPGQTLKNRPCILPSHIERLEAIIDECQTELKPLEEFILPGGGKVPAFLHQARTVCRRAERICVTLLREEAIEGDLVKFLNRLSDALFVLARWVAKAQGEPEFLWEREVAPADQQGLEQTNDS